MCWAVLALLSVPANQLLFVFSALCRPNDVRAPSCSDVTTLMARHLKPQYLSRDDVVILCQMFKFCCFFGKRWSIEGIFFQNSSSSWTRDTLIHVFLPGSVKLDEGKWPKQSVAYLTRTDRFSAPLTHTTGAIFLSKIPHSYSFLAFRLSAKFYPSRSSFRGDRLMRIRQADHYNRPIGVTPMSFTGHNKEQSH